MVTPAYSGCYHVPESTITTAMGIELRAGQAAECGGVGGLFLACAPLPATKVLTGLPAAFADLMVFEPKREVIRVEWADFGVPGLSPEFWYALLENITRTEYKALNVVCVGGHGRTGTALAALIIVGKGLTADEAVNLLRTNYCREVVESTSQVNYLVAVEKWAIGAGLVKAKGPRPQTAWSTRPVPATATGGKSAVQSAITFQEHFDRDAYGAYDDLSGVDLYTDDCDARDEAVQNHLAVMAAAHKNTADSQWTTKPKDEARPENISPRSKAGFKEPGKGGKRGKGKRQRYATGE